MPNGRSGGFIIEKDDLQRLVKAMPEEIGATAAFGSGSTKSRSIAASEMAKLIERCPNDRLAVEEQDHSWYIIHISNEPEIVWVTILPKSQIFPEIRERHKQWTTANPGWYGWIAF